CRLARGDRLDQPGLEVELVSLDPTLERVLPTPRLAARVHIVIAVVIDQAPVGGGGGPEGVPPDLALQQLNPPPSATVEHHQRKVTGEACPLERDDKLSGPG